MSGEKGEQEWQTMWGAEVKVINPGNLMPDDMLKSCITTTQKVRRRFISESCNRHGTTPVSKVEIVWQNYRQCSLVALPRAQHDPAPPRCPFCSRLNPCSMLFIGTFVPARSNANTSLLLPLSLIAVADRVIGFLLIVAPCLVPGGIPRLWKRWLAGRGIDKKTFGHYLVTVVARYHWEELRFFMYTWNKTFLIFLHGRQSCHDFQSWWCPIIYY